MYGDVSGPRKSKCHHYCPPDDTEGVGHDRGRSAMDYFCLFDHGMVFPPAIGWSLGAKSCQFGAFLLLGGRGGDLFG